MSNVTKLELKVLSVFVAMLFVFISWYVWHERTTPGEPAYETPRTSESATDGLTAEGSIKQLNDYRVANKLSPLEENEVLNSVALEHAKDMQTRHYYEHVTPDGVTPQQRILKSIPTALATGENEDNLCDNPTNKQEFERFRDSPEHRQNMLAPNINAVGIGIVKSDFSACNGYIVFDFAQL